MVRKSVPAGRRGFGALLRAGGLGVVVVATVAACGSTSGTSGASGTASSSAPAVTSSSAAPSTSASSSGGAASGSPTTATATATGSSTSNHPLIPTGGIVTSPKAQVTTVPAGSRLTAFQSAARSKDGMTLYLGIESQGGACGQYDVVVQQSSTTVSVGLVHLAPGARVCPMYVTRMLIPAKLSSPLGGRSVVDLENGQVVQAPVQS